MILFRTMKMYCITVIAACLLWGSSTCFGLRDSELSSATQELTMVLRGLRSDIASNFEKLLSDLHQDRLGKTEQNMALRDKVEENRLDIEVLRGQIASLTTTPGCLKDRETLAIKGAAAGGVGVGAGGRSAGGGIKTEAGGRGAGSGVGGGVGGRGSVRGRPVDNWGTSTLQRGTESPLESPFHQDKVDEESLSAVQTPHTIECPAPYQRVGEHCLTMLRDETAWDVARTRCHSYARSHVSHLPGSSHVNGDLVVPHDMEAFKHFIESNDFSGKAWVGASTEGWGGVWAWIDGSLIKELPWLYSQPGLSGGLLAVDSEANFHAVQHRQNHYPICEITL